VRVLAVSDARIRLWPQPGLVALLDQLVISTDRGDLWLPRGMRSDGASVPAPLWAALSGFDSSATPTKLLLMGVGHDGAYRTDAVWSNAADPILTRPEADDLARALALYSGVSERCAGAIRWGLGVGAASHWHQKRLDWRP
jgi:hypothetical protein